MTAPDAALARLDHLIVVAPDLEAAVESIERRLGARSGGGGRHPGRGTRNALLAIGGRRYLEILAPDPAQPEPAEPRWMGVDAARDARLATWAATAGDLEGDRARAAAAGVPLGAVGGGSRLRDDGRELAWRFTDPRAVVADGVVPFLIDWGDGPHPSAEAPEGPTLVALRAIHPRPESVRPWLAALGLELPVEAGEAAGLVATFETPDGFVELR